MVGISSEFITDSPKINDELKDGICNFLHYERITISNNSKEI